MEGHPMSIVKLNDVHRSYGRTDALQGLNLTIESSEVVGLVGRNGAGKSTLLRLLPPLIHPTKGTVRVFDLDPWNHQSEVKQRLGYVGDQGQIPFGVRVRDLLELCAYTYRRWDLVLVERFRKRLAINPNDAVTTLSLGQQRQIALLCAIGHRPELLLLDEPAGNLDPAMRREFLGVVIELLSDAGSTVVLATHLFGDLERLVNRLVIIDHGRVVTDGSVDSLKQGLCRVELAADAVPTGGWKTCGLCLQHQDSGQSVVAVLDCPVTEAAQRLEQAFGVQARPRSVMPVGLEDAFIYRTQPASNLVAP
jgi:ABC-2 type transport system ATP-binding protein